MENRPWVCRYEIREDGVYREGVKLSDEQSQDLRQRFEHEQELFIGAKKEPILTRLLRRLGGSGENGNHV